MTQKNYINIFHTHIFINFTSHNLDFLNEMHPGSIRKIHVFITNHASINESLKFLADRYAMVIIHTPRHLPVLETLAYKFITSCNRVIYTNREVLFGSYGMLRIIYKKDYLEIVTPKSTAMVIKFPKYPYNLVDEDTDKGVFESAEMRLNPEMFKDKLISEFKRQVPSGILKAFKTDDDIFEYIMQQGEWNVKERDS